MAGMAAAAAAAASMDRLSNLPDDLLIHILSFGPTCEAARTTALSRRWRRPLWLHTAAVNLDYRSYTTGAGGVPLGLRAVKDAEHALAFQNSLGCGPKKVALVMRDGTMHDDILRAACGREEDAASVEEIRLECLEYSCRPHYIRAAPPRWTYYDLSLVWLPYAGLRVLDLTGCILSPLPSSEESEEEDTPSTEGSEEGGRRITFPSLEQVFAAPKLDHLRLEAVSFSDYLYMYCLCCPAATVITMANCHMLSMDNVDFYMCRVELDAPRLRRLSFSQVHTFGDSSGSYTSFTFKSWAAPPDLEQVHLALHSGLVAGGLRRSMLMVVCHVRALTLTMYSISDLAGYGLSQFHKLERLEIEELCGCIVNHSKAANAVENLLRNCPVVRHLRLRFRWREYLAETSDPADQMAARADLAPCRSINDTGYDDDEEECCENLDLYYQHCGRDLDCLRGSLKRVVVEFDAEELTCFQVRLIRFLARDAAGLEEVVVDGGKGYDSSRINRKVERWRRKWKLSPPMTSPAPLWPPTRSEFPLPIKAAVPVHKTSPCSEVEVDNGLQFYDNDDEEEDDEEDDISPRHFMRGGRKKKKGGGLECFSVKLKAKGGLITMRSRRGGANRRHRKGWGWFGEDGGVAGSSVASSPPMVPAISDPQRLPTMYDFPLLPCAPPPAPRRLPSLSESFPLDQGPPSAPPCPGQTTPIGLCPDDNTCVRREWRAVRLADLDVATDMTSRRRYLSRRRPLAPTMPSGRRRAAAFRIHQPSKTRRCCR